MFSEKEVKRLLYVLSAKFITSHFGDSDRDALNFSIGEYDLFYNLSTGNRSIYFEGASIDVPDICGLFDQLLAEEFHDRVTQGKIHLTMWVDYKVVSN